MVEVTAHGMRLRDHGPNVLNSFSEMRDAGILTDVTIYSHGVAIPCHKVVLAATSIRFLDLLSALGPMACPTIVLNQYDPDMLKLVVDFIYKGEVNCTFGDIPRFLNTALRLGVLEDYHIEEAIAFVQNADGDEDFDAIVDMLVDLLIEEEEVVEEEEEAGEEEQESGEQGEEDDGIETENELDVEASCIPPLRSPMGMS
jgi:hypothetical protein